MTKFYSYTLLLAILLTQSLMLRAANPDKSADDEYLAVATSWLKLTDEANYEASWKNANSSLQAQMPLKTWSDNLANTRSPFGKLVKRKLITGSYTRYLFSQPGKEIVVIKFNTDFEKRSDIKETVILTPDKDNRFKVSGYLLK